MSNSVQPHRRQPTRLPRPWDFPGKNTGVGCHFLLQCVKVKSESEVAQSCLTLRDPMDCSPPGSSIRGIFQARVLEWGAMMPNLTWEKILFQPRDKGRKVALSSVRLAGARMPKLSQLETSQDQVPLPNLNYFLVWADPKIPEVPQSSWHFCISRNLWCWKIFEGKKEHREWFHDRKTKTKNSLKWGWEDGEWGGGRVRSWARFLL